jgi:hypothetical protein
MLRSLLVLLLVFVSCRVAFGAEWSHVPGHQSPLPAERVVAGLPWRFKVSIKRQQTTNPLPLGSSLGWDQRISYQFTSAQPYRATAQGPLFLRAELTLDRFDNSQDAEQAFQSLSGEAHPDMGLSYAWDHVLLSGHTLFHLHAGCAFSEEHFQHMVTALGTLAEPSQQRNARNLRCRCGGGCREITLPPPP